MGATWSVAMATSETARLAVFNALPDPAALVAPAGTITEVNAAWRTFAALGGGDPEEAGVGTNYFDVCRRAAAGGDVDSQAVADGLEAVLSGRLRSFEHRYPCPSPIESRWFVARITPLDEPGGGALVCHLDVTAWKLTEDRLVFRASHDPLTGLANREQVLAHLRTALARLARAGAPVAVLFLDLDRFKPVNDHYGHAAGDRVLVQVANRLRHQMRATDIVGRVGGDEFLVVCDADKPAALVDRLRDAVRSPIQLGADVVSVGLSIGVAEASVPVGDDLDSAAGALVARADAAMYEDKRRRLATA
jgi:diguanylate cyclase (GGDEF)-like protein